MIIGVRHRPMYVRLGHGQTGHTYLSFCDTINDPERNSEVRWLSINLVRVEIGQADVAFPN